MSIMNEVANTTTTTITTTTAALHSLEAVAATLRDRISSLESAARDMSGPDQYSRGYTLGLREGTSSLRDVLREVELQIHALTLTLDR